MQHDNIVGYYEALGVMVWLMSQQQGQERLQSIERELVPALELEQYKIYYRNTGEPFGFVTWAWLSDEARAQVIKSQGALATDLWHSGPHLMVKDIVAPWGNVAAIFSDLKYGIFRHHSAFSITRHPDGALKNFASRFCKNACIPSF